MTKNFRRFPKGDRLQILQLMRRIQMNDLIGMDVKKLKDRSDVYRVRKGNIRIIFRKMDQRPHIIIAVERRSDTTYNQF